ncbi:MAG: HPP family protein [Candidatus Binataceae bacterium]
MSRERAAAAAPLDGLYRLGGELIALAYIAIIAEIACATGAVYVLFPELGALSHDVMTRPRGTWANAPLLLAITPVLTGVVGIVFTRSLPYGYLSVLLTVGGAIAVVLALRSPVAPAISAGLLPLVLGVKSWWYPPAIALGTVLLATLCVPWKKYCATRMVAAAPAESDKARENLHNDLLDDLIEMPPSGYGWLVVLMAFVAFAMFFVKLTGLRFVLFPPLVVIGFEMLGHTAICPWADKPMRLPLACFLTALGGFISWHFLGVTPLAAACSMAWGIAVLRMFDLHVPPALAVALLPLVMDKPTIAYPFAVGIGTTLLSLWFLAYQRLSRGALSIPWASRAAARQ